MKVTALVQAVDKWFETAAARDGPIIPAMSWLRFLMLLSLVVWIGGLIFFAFVVAPVVFAPGLLPSRHLAGEIVARSVGALHWMGIFSGITFLLASTVYSRVTVGRARLMAARNVMIVLMLGLTLISQFAVTPEMHAIRDQTGVIDNLAVSDPVRVEFDRLHLWSERIEEGVFFLGLVALYMTARELR